jgi:hypothetical protein
MALNLKNRQLLLIITLVVSVLLAVFAPQNQQPTELAHDAKPNLDKTNAYLDLRAKNGSNKPNDLLPNKRNLLLQEPKELFLVDRVKASKISAIEVKVPPPLPFAYMGKIIDDGKLTIFLTRDDKTYAISAGETIDNEYKVNSISPQRVEFTYIPLGQKQTMMTGAN